MIEAAGGVVWRTSVEQILEVLLVHRPKYDDWSLPKGKLTRGEAPLAGALRKITWTPVDDAAAVLTNGRDVTVVAALEGILVPRN